MARIAINGLGRIGRATLKMLMDASGVEIVAVNDLLPAENLAYLLKFDTVYGRYDKAVYGEGETLRVGDVEVKLLNVKDPGELPWREMKIDIVLECTGIFTKRIDLEKHRNAGARYVMLSAPAKSPDVKTIVPGVNSAAADDTIFSTASCTTNCITPVIEIMARRIGLEKAIMTTIHAYTSTQSLVDGPNKKRRRGRAAAANFIPTSTGAAIATTNVISEFKGKFDGVAIRGPVPVGSISDIVCIASRDTSVDEINQIFQEESETERYTDIMGVTEENIVSSDIIGDPRASIVDLTMTKVVDGNLVKIMSWYDNEWGYAAQMVREIVRMADTLG